MSGQKRQISFWQKVCHTFLELPLHGSLPVASGHRVALHHLVARVGEVVALQGDLQRVASYAEALVQLKVYGLPCAQQVVAVVGDERKAFARVEPRGAEAPSVVAEVYYDGGAVQRRVGYGVAILGVVGRGVVAVALAGVVGRGRG